MSEITEVMQETLEPKSESSLNSWIAVLVALTATCMAICNIKDGNIVQAMTQAQARGVDAWTYYQAKSTKQLLSENMVEQVKTQLATASTLAPAARTLLEEKSRQYLNEAKRYEQEKEEVKTKAENFEKEYDQLNTHDDQFDMADAVFTIAIALYGITALVKKKWLLIFALALTTIGIVFGLAGFLGWSLHPDWLAKILG